MVNLSYVVSYSQLKIWSHLKTTQVLVNVWQALETSHSKSSLGNFKQNTCIN